jgi:hypothetical protein
LLMLSSGWLGCFRVSMLFVRAATVPPLPKGIGRASANFKRGLPRWGNPSGAAKTSLGSLPVGSPLGEAEGRQEARVESWVKVMVKKPVWRVRLRLGALIPKPIGWFGISPCLKMDLTLT